MRALVIGGGDYLIWAKALCFPEMVQTRAYFDHRDSVRCIKLAVLVRHRDRVDKTQFVPNVTWRG